MFLIHGLRFNSIEEVSVYIQVLKCVNFNKGKTL